MRVAIVGTGSQYGLGRLHAEVYDERPECDHLALCDLRREASEQVAEGLSTPTSIHTSIEDLFAQGSIDAISILTPDALHLPHARMAFAAGADVLLTKPLATNLSDARAIVEAAAASGRRLMVAHEARYRPEYRRAKELIVSGRLGELAFVGVTELYQAVREKFANAPWYASATSGRTMITGSGIHQVDIVRWLIGQEVRGVLAAGNRVGDLEYHHNKTVVAIYQCAGPTVGEVVMSYEGMPGMTRGGLIVIGSKGMISLGTFRDRAGNEQSLETAPGESSHKLCLRAFLDALRDNLPLPITGQDAFTSLSVAVAINEACDTSALRHPECF